MLDYLDRAALLALDLDEQTVRRLLAASPLTGHDGHAVVEAKRLNDLLAQLRAEEEKS